MKFSWFNQTILLAVFLFAIAACTKREDQQVILPDNTNAGKGGNATFKITAQRNGVDIDSAQVFIRYNAQIPGPYDDSAWVTIYDQKPPVVTFSGLKKGDYFIHIKGWDLINSKTVYGDRFYTITTDTTATYTLIVPVN